jgi:hypothetical protein
MSSSAAMASTRSILAISSASEPAARSSSRAWRMSAPDLGKDTATKSQVISAAVRMSSMSLAVSAGAERPPPCLLMPLLLDSVPPTRTRQRTSRFDDLSDFQHDAAVVEQQHVAGGEVVDQVGIVEADAPGVARLFRGVEHEGVAGLQLDLAGGELADADLRPLQVDHDADGAADLAHGLAQQRRRACGGRRPCRGRNSGARHRRRRRSCASSTSGSDWPGRGWRRFWLSAAFSLSWPAVPEAAHPVRCVPPLRAASCPRGIPGRRRRRSKCRTPCRRCRTSGWRRWCRRRRPG